jgi:hypothetical protein
MFRSKVSQVENINDKLEFIRIENELIVMTDKQKIERLHNELAIRFNYENALKELIQKNKMYEALFDDESKKCEAYEIKCNKMEEQIEELSEKKYSLGNLFKQTFKEKDNAIKEKDNAIDSATQLVNSNKRLYSELENTSTKLNEVDFKYKKLKFNIAINDLLQDDTFNSSFNLRNIPYITKYTNDLRLNRNTECHLFKNDDNDKKRLDKYKSVLHYLIHMDEELIDDYSEEFGGHNIIDFLIDDLNKTIASMTKNHYDDNYDHFWNFT